MDEENPKELQLMQKRMQAVKMQYIVLLVAFIVYFFSIRYFVSDERIRGLLIFPVFIVVVIFFIITINKIIHLKKEVRAIKSGAQLKYDITNKQIEKSKPPYLLGLLCLIPGFGLLIGLALLLYGIIKYKDKWLIIIGTSGIIWTVAIYSILIFVSNHADFFKQGWSEVSQHQLNDLVKNVEFYKLEHGRYPDSLQQLTKEDQFVFINDPIQQNKKNENYNYKRIGDKYVLFSSGEDGIPNTKDDLFPQIVISDSSKIGLIKPK